MADRDRSKNEFKRWIRQYLEHCSTTGEENGHRGAYQDGPYVLVQADSLREWLTATGAKNASRLEMLVKMREIGAMPCKIKGHSQILQEETTRNYWRISAVRLGEEPGESVS